jgi:hypothetical protein
MKNLIIVAAGLWCAGCSGGAAKSDTAVARDTTPVAGPPAIPSTGAVATASPAPATARPPAGTKSPPAGGTRPARDSSAQSTPASVQSDSIRGKVSVVGTSFDKRVMIAETGSRRRIEVTGSLASLIGHLAGTEIAASGALSGTRLEARSFVVRSVDGQPAIDGTLRTENGVLYIVTANGARTRIAAPPPPLTGRDGARVWITGDPAKGVSSFGFIDPPR